MGMNEWWADSWALVLSSGYFECRTNSRFAEVQSQWSNDIRLMQFYDVTELLITYIRVDALEHKCFQVNHLTIRKKTNKHYKTIKPPPTLLRWRAASVWVFETRGTTSLIQPTKTSAFTITGAHLATKTTLCTVYPCIAFKFVYYWYLRALQYTRDTKIQLWGPSILTKPTRKMIWRNHLCAGGTRLLSSTLENVLNLKSSSIMISSHCL